MTPLKVKVPTLSQVPFPKSTIAVFEGLLSFDNDTVPLVIWYLQFNSTRIGLVISALYFTPFLLVPTFTPVISYLSSIIIKRVDSPLTQVRVLSEVQVCVSPVGVVTFPLFTVINHCILPAVFRPLFSMVLVPSILKSF